MTAARRPSDTDHGYLNYTYGCRCTICRKAKADYVRARRAAGRHTAQVYAAVTGQRHIADTATHGTRYAYEELGCRCQPCTTARTTSDRKYRQTSSQERAA